MSVHIEPESSPLIDWQGQAVRTEEELPADWHTWRSRASRDPNGDQWTVYERLDTSAYVLRVPDECVAYGSRAPCCVHDLSGPPAADADYSGPETRVPPHFCEQRSDSRDTARVRSPRPADAGTGARGEQVGARMCASGATERLAATSLRVVDTAIVSEGVRRQTMQNRHVECAVRMPAHWAYIVRVEVFEVFDCHFLDHDAFVEIWAGVRVPLA